jgi:hypothetical protein
MFYVVCFWTIIYQVMVLDIAILAWLQCMLCNVRYSDSIFLFNSKFIRMIFYKTKSYLSLLEKRKCPDINHDIANSKTHLDAKINPSHFLQIT